MKTIKLKKENIYKGSLILVNADYPIVKDKANKNVSLIPLDIRFPEILMEYRAATVLAHLMVDLNCSHDIVPVSGYRSFEEQEQIYSESLRENGEEFTKKYVALPNHSEHQTGLAIDLAKNQDNIDFICPEFPYDGIYNDFRKEAPRYGFIERYEKGKEKITGISQEPWHFRYVGYPHSQIMYDNSLCLEEYIDKIKSYTWNNGPLSVEKGNQKIEIFYIPILSEEDERTILVKDYDLYQISGNNVDGCIITLWRGK
ncbi:M15 family metallopeptidase [Wansuia hejianensis]|uniref:M15 family metallopeptidase n=1 Tax=Wansuia hejianensis TaxID=2763667 RepID=A0A926F188_9FIRM|nr:M15 family metallopeptidase [Wansuia hejianensis]MBC8590152.1 M15 family metallopeptidase [Wansuia hejianensis]